MNLRRKRVFLTVMVLMLTLSMLLAGCSQPANNPGTQQPEPSSGPSVEDNLLKWDDWSAKMTGTINKDYYVVDLRTPDEIKLEKALEGSINIDANETLAKGNHAVIDEALAGIPKDSVILIHCKSGGRVKANLAAFLEKGYENAFGLNGWTVFDSKGFFKAVEISSNTEFLTPEAWEGKMEGEIGKDYYVVDVRDQKEYADGHIKGAINIGVRDQLTVDHEAAIAKLNSEIADKDALILVHCAVGKRAKVGIAHLKAAGYTNVVVLDNVINIDKDGNYKFE